MRWLKKKNKIKPTENRNVALNNEERNVAKISCCCVFLCLGATVFS
jgi:hypothetical protein